MFDVLVVRLLVPPETVLEVNVHMTRTHSGHCRGKLWSPLEAGALVVQQGIFHCKDFVQ